MSHNTLPRDLPPIQCCVFRPYYSRWWCRPQWFSRPRVAYTAATSLLAHKGLYYIFTGILFGPLSQSRHFISSVIEAKHSHPRRLAHLWTTTNKGHAAAPASKLIRAPKCCKGTIREMLLPNFFLIGGPRDSHLPKLFLHVHKLFIMRVYFSVSIIDSSGSHIIRYWKLWIPI